jgi:predicted metal-binding protein
VSLAIKSSVHDAKAYDAFQPIDGDFCTHNGKKVFKTFFQAEHRAQKIGTDTSHWLRPYKCEYCSAIVCKSGMI